MIPFIRRSLTPHLFNDSEVTSISLIILHDASRPVHYDGSRPHRGDEIDSVVGQYVPARDALNYVLVPLLHATVHDLLARHRVERFL